MFISWAFFNNFADGKKVFSKCLSHVSELISFELVQRRNNALNKHLRVEDQPEIRKPPDCGSFHLWLNILQELAVIRSQMFSCVFDPDAISNFHNFVSYQVSDSPAFIDGKLLNERD